MGVMIADRKPHIVSIITAVCFDHRRTIILDDGSRCSLTMWQSRQAPVRSLSDSDPRSMNGMQPMWSYLDVADVARDSVTKSFDEPDYQSHHHQPEHDRQDRPSITPQY